MEENTHLFGYPITGRMLNRGRAVLFGFTLMWGIGLLLFFRVVISRYELLFTGTKFTLPSSVALMLSISRLLAEPAGLLGYLILILLTALGLDWYFRKLGKKNPEDANINQDLWILGGALLFPFVLFMIQLIMILPYYRVSG